MRYRDKEEEEEKEEDGDDGRGKTASMNQAPVEQAQDLLERAKMQWMDDIGGDAKGGTGIGVVEPAASLTSSQGATHSHRFDFEGNLLLPDARAYPTPRTPHQGPSNPWLYCTGRA
jgi:hypothetical protein